MKPTGSKLAVLQYCAYYARPDVMWLEDGPGDAARFGNAIHALADAAISSRPLTLEDAAKAAGVPEGDRARLGRVWAVALDWITTHARIGWRSEVKLAWDWEADTARELAAPDVRDYTAAGPTELCGTADVVTMEDGTVVVYDWKTGQSPLESYESQAAFLALAAARLFGADRAVARWVRFSEDGVEVKEWAYDLMDLDANAAHLAERMRAAVELQAEPQPGAHCSDLYCPARVSCPMTGRIVRSNPDTAPLAELVATAIQTPAQAGAAYRQLRLVKDAVKVVEDRIRDVVEREGSAPTAPGKVLRLVTSTRETFAQARIPPERRDEVLADLRALGALQTSTSASLREGKA